MHARAGCGTIGAVVRLLRLPLVLAIGLGFGLAAGPADAQLWKPDKKKPAATATKAKSAPTASRKVSKPTKRKARPKKVRRKAPAPKVTSADDVDDDPIIVITPGDPDE
jgi:hypothetical protein